MIEQAFGNNNEFSDYVGSVGKDLNVESSANDRGSTGARKQQLIIGGLLIEKRD